MTLADSMYSSTEKIMYAYVLFQAHRYKEVIELLDPVVNLIRSYQKEQPNVFAFNLNLGQALEHSSNAKSVIGSLDDAVLGWCEAIQLFDSALAVPLEEINRQFLELGLLRYQIKDEEALSRVKLQLQVGKAGSSYRLASVLKQKGQGEEAKRYWESAKSTYAEIVNNKRAPPELLVDVAIYYAKMCLKDDDLNQAQSLFMVALEHPTLNPFDELRIRASLEMIATARHKN